MGEKYYKPILKDGDHLVQSKKNPKRVRGQSRDADNKNPDIPEWEEVEIEEIVPQKSPEELEYELSKMAHEERRAEQEKVLSTLDTIDSVLKLFNEVLVFLNDHPEVASAVINGGCKIKNAISSGIRSAALGVKSLFPGSRKTKAKAILDKKVTISSTSTEMEQIDLADVIEDQVEINEDEREEMSIDEARSLVISILESYVSMKQNIDRLSKARINDVNMPQLDMNQVLAYMNSIVERYPALMDEKTSLSVLDILHANSNTSENEKIIEVLKIEQ